ncbi:MAG: hypothetical protein ABSG36_14835 [Acidimicrobiales bacterium]
MAGAIFVGVFVAFLVSYVVAVVRSDGKRAALRGKPFPVREPAGITTIEASWEQAAEISRDAIRTLGASDFRVIDGVGVVGWKGIAYWRGLPSNRPLEMGVLIYALDGEHEQLVSYARPRFARVDLWMGGRRSLELGTALAREVSRRSTDGVAGTSTA